MSRLTRKSIIQSLLALALVASGYYGAVTSAQAPNVDKREEIQRLAKELTDQPAEKLAVAALPNRVESLLKAKRDVLKRRYETVVAMSEVGASIGATEVIRARVAWIDAELDLTRDPTQRIKLLRENIDAAVQIEALILAKIENGAAGGEQISYLAAQAARFDAELRLANELLAQNKAKSK